MHESAHNYVQSVYDVLELPITVLEFGSRNVNGSARDIFQGQIYWGIDLIPGDGVDRVANAASYRHPEPVDVVLCLETLEHTSQSQQIVKNAARNLRAGGLLIVTCATDPRLPHSAVDGGELRIGEYYKNLTPDELKHYAVSAWLEVLELLVKNIPNHGGDLYMTARKEGS